MNVYKLCRLFLVVVVLVSPMASGYAQGPGGTSNEEQMQQMLDMIKGMSQGSGQGKGMDEKTQKQLENMFKGMGQQMDKRQAAQIQKEQEQFEAATVGHGTAIVEVEGKRYDLTVTKCELWGGGSGKFKIEARQPPAKGSWKLSMGADKTSRVGLTFQAGRRGYWREGGGTVDQSSSLVIKDNGLEWNGLVGEGENMPATIQVTCGAEMVNYATPSQSNPASSVNVLTLQMGKEIHTFEAGLCSTEEYRTGNLMVQFEATATGTFRGRPAIILMSKSYPHGSVAAKQTFQDMDLLLGQLTPEQRMLPPLKVMEQLNKKVETFSSTETAAVQKKYQKKIATWQKQFDVEMPALKKQYGKAIPPEKMSALMAPFNQLMDAQGKEMDKVQEQAKAMRYPKGRSFGTITVKGQEVHFGGSKLSTQDTHRAPEFKNLPEKTELWVTCGK